MEQIELIKTEEVEQKNKKHTLGLQEEKFKASEKIRTRRKEIEQLDWIKLSEFTLDTYIPQDDLLRKVDSEIDFSFVTPEFAKYYKNADGAGRPAEDPERIFRQLLCLLIERIKSERQLERDTVTNLRLRWFCKYSLFEKIPDHSTISKMRYRCIDTETGENGFDIIFQRIVQQCLEKGYIDNDVSIDRTGVISPETPLSSCERAKIITREIMRIIQLGDGIDKILEKEEFKNVSDIGKIALANIITELTKVDKRSRNYVVNKIKELFEKDIHEVLKMENRNKKRKSGILLHLKWRISEKFKKDLKEKIKLLLNLIKKIDEEFKSRFKKTYTYTCNDVKNISCFVSDLINISKGKIKNINEEVKSEARNFLIYLRTKKSNLIFEFKKSIIKLMKIIEKVLKEMPQGRSDNSSARFGHTSRVEKFFGSNATFTLDHKEDIITAVEWSKADDSKKFKEVYNKHKKVCGKPSSTRADGEYDTKEVRNLLREDNVKAYISLKPPSRQDKFTTEDFKIDENGNAICPANKIMERIGSSDFFRGKDCIGCKLKHRCTDARKRTVRLNVEEILEKEIIKKFNRTDEYKKEIKKRLRLEASIGHNKVHHHLDKWLYRNPEMQKVQLNLIGIVHNIEKMVRIKGREKMRTMIVEIQKNLAAGRLNLLYA